MERGKSTVKNDNRQQIKGYLKWPDLTYNVEDDSQRRGLEEIKANNSIYSTRKRNVREALSRASEKLDSVASTLSLAKGKEKVKHKEIKDEWYKHKLMQVKNKPSENPNWRIRDDQMHFLRAGQFKIKFKSRQQSLEIDNTTKTKKPGLKRKPR